MKYFEVFITSLRLGLTSFGGPVAHLGYFHDEYVKKKKWLSEEAYADLVALCQFLPGPASSQVGMAIGQYRAGIVGAILAWIGFTLPSAVVLTLFGLGMTSLDLAKHQNWIHGLKVVAVAIVAQAIFGMAKKLCPDKERMSIALIACAGVLFFETAFAQILILVLCGAVGKVFLRSLPTLPHESIHVGNKKTGTVFLSLFVSLLIFLPLLSKFYPHTNLEIFDSFYRSGALVFGGGHVVLPLLQAEVLQHGWMSKDLFMAGYGIANAVPGPLFTFGSYLGAVTKGISGSIISLFAIFLPSFLLIVGILPFWERLRSLTLVRQTMLGLNAGVVGILLAALYNPVWVSAIFGMKDFTLALVCFFLLEFAKLPSWLIILATVSISFFLF